MATIPLSFLGAKETAALAGIPYTTLVSWIKKNLLPEPSMPANGTGTRRLFALLDVVQARLVARLRAQGVEAEVIRQVLAELSVRWAESPDALDGHLVVAGETILWNVDDEELAQVIGERMANPEITTEPLAILPIAALVADTDAKMRESAIA